MSAGPGNPTQLAPEPGRTLNLRVRNWFISCLLSEHALPSGRVYPESVHAPLGGHVPT